MKKNNGRVILVFLVCLGYLEAWAYNLPSVAEVRVVHPSDNDSEGFVHIHLEWNNDPGFLEGQAFEIGLIVDPKYFAIPRGGNDKILTTGFKFLKDNQPVSCGYRDVLNYSNASSWQEAIDLVRTYCGVEDWLSIGSIALLKLTFVADDVANFSVGTYCPELDIEKGAEYDIFYYLWPSPQSLVLDDPDTDEGFGWIVVEVSDDTCNGTVECPYTFGNIPSLGCGGESDVWHNRICVPTDLISFTPMEVGEGQGLGTECVDEDDDDIFALQWDSEENCIPMFGSNVGDCNDDDSGLGVCFPLLDSPADGNNLLVGGNAIFSWTSESPCKNKHTLRINRTLSIEPVFNQEFDVDIIGYEVPGSVLSVPGHYQWTVCYPGFQCSEGACCAKVRTFTVESREIPECSPEIEEVTPHYACPGDDFEFNLFGSCLKRDVETDQIRVHIDDVELMNINLIGDSFVEASAHVWDGAMPGPRTVIYANSDSEVTVASGLFEILGPEECEETPPSCPPCPDTEYGEWSNCGGFTSACDETGTRQCMVTHYECMAEAGVCFSYSTSETEICSRDTDDLSCGVSGATCVNGECV